MAKPEDIKALLQTLVANVAQKPKAQDAVKKWVNDYYGKIIAFKAGDQDFFLVFRPDGSASLYDGEPASFDLYIRGDPESLLNVLQGRARPLDLMAKGKIMIWGNFHEAAGFTQVMTAAFLG